VRITVFASASRQAPTSFLDAATTFGRELAEAGIGVVYGGGDVGLMGALAAVAAFVPPRHKYDRDAG
jgi:predicted Rossmann-fold nucleotide-binding protein